MSISDNIIWYVGVTIMAIAVVYVLYLLSGSTTSIEFLESATCKELLELIKNSNYGVEYHSKWIAGECWK